MVILLPFFSVILSVQESIRYFFQSIAILTTLLKWYRYINFFRKYSYSDNFTEKVEIYQLSESIAVLTTLLKSIAILTWESIALLTTLFWKIKIFWLSYSIDILTLSWSIDIIITLTKYRYFDSIRKYRNFYHIICKIYRYFHF